MKSRLFSVFFILLLAVSLVGCNCSHDWTEADCANPQTCAKCQEVGATALGHEWQDATCTAPKTCGKCGETEGSVLSHIQGVWEVESEASYSKPGVQKAYCSLCGELLAEEEFLKERIQNGVFVFSRQELMDMLKEALAEYSSDFKVYDDTEYLSVADLGDVKVDYLLLLLCSGKGLLN